MLVTSHYLTLPRGHAWVMPCHALLKSLFRAPQGPSNDTYAVACAHSRHLSMHRSNIFTTMFRSALAHMPSCPCEI